MESGEVCRLCLNPSLKMHSLLKENHLTMLTGLTGIKYLSCITRVKRQYLVLSGEHSQSCIKCLVDLKMAYNIQQRFIDSNKKIQDLPRISENSLFLKTELGTTEELEPLADNKLSQNVDDFLNDITETTNHTIFGEVVEPVGSDLDNNSRDSYTEFILIESKNDNDSDVAKICRCYICNLCFNNDSELYEHIKKHYETSPSCEHCGTKLEDLLAYREHLNADHKDLKIITWNCEECNLVFEYKCLFDMHMTSFHHPDSLYKKSTKSERKCKVKKKPVLKITKKRRPNIEKEPFEVVCECCNRVYTNASSYRSHVNGTQKKKCPICSTEITQYNLKKHIAMHNMTPVVCHLCGVTAKNIESLRGHLFYTHSQQQFPCEHCGKVYRKKYQRNIHIKMHHSGEKAFICDTCGKNFFTKYKLRCHIKTVHLLERKHVCKYCQKGFSTRFAMRTHERQHTNETPYVCDMCGEGFRQKVSLRSHRKSKHNIVEKATIGCKVCGKKFASDFAIMSHMRLHA